MRFHEIQQAVHVGKDKRNDFGKYNYRTAEGILAAAKAILADGEYIILDDDISEVCGQIFVTSSATLYAGEVKLATARGHAMHPLTKKGMDPSQITGAASSYARKYALSGLFALDDGSVDPDAAKGAYEPDITDVLRMAIKAIGGTTDLQSLQQVWTANKDWQKHPDFVAAKDKRKEELQ